MRTELKGISAESINTGIIFYSKKHMGYIAIATIDNHDEIKTEWTTMKEYIYNEKTTNTKKLFWLVFYSLIIVFYVLLDQITNRDFMLGIRFFLVGCSCIVIGGFIVKTKIERKEEERSYKFHSAEHMVLNAYRELKRVPSLDEIRQFSRFSNSCGTNSITLIVLDFLLMFICTFISNASFMLFGIVFVNILLIVMLKNGFLNFLQIFTTIPPTDVELIVAIKGMSVLIANENKKRESSYLSKLLNMIHMLFSKIFN